MNVDKMRRQLERTAPFECGRRGCQINSRPHWDYMQRPGTAEEVVYTGSEREREIVEHERRLSSVRTANPGNGDVRCPNDGEWVNVRCWNCGWVRNRLAKPTTLEPAPRG